MCGRCVLNRMRRITKYKSWGRTQLANVLVAIGRLDTWTCPRGISKLGVLLQHSILLSSSCNVWNARNCHLWWTAEILQWPGTSPKYYVLPYSAGPIAITDQYYFFYDDFSVNSSIWSTDIIFTLYNQYEQHHDVL